MVITSTPVKQHLERKENEKKVKEEKKVKRKTKVKNRWILGKLARKRTQAHRMKRQFSLGVTKNMKTHQKRNGFSVMNVRSGGMKTVPNTKVQDTFYTTTVDIKMYAILPHLEGKMTNLRS